MPMQYPPLSDGTYRYGDQPRPLPSPVPGPDADPAAEFHTATLPYAPGGPHHPATRPHHPATRPHHPATAPHEGAAPHSGPAPHEGTPPHDDPSEQAAEDARKRSRDKLAAAAIVGAAGLVVVVIMGLAFLGPGSGPTTSPGGPDPRIPGAPGPAPAPGGVFAVDGQFTVVTSPGEPVSGDATGCDLPITLSDIGEGSTIALSLQDGTRIDQSGLTYEGGDLSSCTFTFDFPEVPSGVGSYLVELDGRGRLVYSEQELRAGVEITLGR